MHVRELEYQIFDGELPAEDEDEPICRRGVRRKFLPYGKWTCSDGREVLFNRAYSPIWERYPGKRAALADPHEWVRDIARVKMLYTDWTPEAEKQRKGIAALEAFTGRKWLPIFHSAVRP